MIDETLVTFINLTAIPLSLFLIMLGMGLTLTIKDFKRVALYPKAVAIGLTNQLLVLPIVGFVVASTMPLSPELAVGLMLVVVCPGGTTSNLFTYLARGDVALSITLTAIASVITIFTIPFIINAALKFFMGSDTTLSLPVLTTIRNLVLITLLPISLGMIARHVWPQFAATGAQLATRFAVVFMVALICYSVYQQRDILVSALMAAGPAVILLNISTMAIGYISARALKLSRPQQVSVTLEVGLQNSALAMMMALGLLSNYQMSLTPGVYSLVMFFTAGLVVRLTRHRPPPQSSPSTSTPAVP